MNWLDLLAVQGTLKSLLQHHSSKASILQHSAYFIVQLSHPYRTTGKTNRVMSLLCNALSGFLMAFQLDPYLLLVVAVEVLDSCGEEMLSFASSSVCKSTFY